VVANIEFHIPASLNLLLGRPCNHAFGCCSFFVTTKDQDAKRWGKGEWLLSLIFSQFQAV